MLRQVTDIRPGPAPSDPKEAEGQRAFLEEQQVKLFDFIRRRKEAREEREAEREAAEGDEPKPTYLAAGERAGNPIPNATATHAVITANRPAQGDQQTIVPNWITESGYTEDLTVRTKVGDATGSSRVGLLDTVTGEVVWLDLFPLDNETDEGMAAPEAAVIQEVGSDIEESGPDLSFASFAGWNESGTHALVASSSFDREWRWIYSLEAATGKLTLLDALQDQAWAAGPCSRCIGWLPNSDRAYFVSEATGFAHLYAIDADGSDRAQLTQGDWEVLQVEIPRGGDRLVLHTNEGSPFNQHVYTMGFDGSRRTAITTDQGGFDATLSPDGREGGVGPLGGQPTRGAVPVGLRSGGLRGSRSRTRPPRSGSAFPWIKPEIIQLPGRGRNSGPGPHLPAGGTWAPRPTGPAVIFVHGAGYLHNVHNYWSSYSREYMFNHFLAANGYTVLDIDYRGSAGYGRDWRTGIYRWMGGKDLSDQVDGARYLVAKRASTPPGSACTGDRTEGSSPSWHCSPTRRLQVRRRASLGDRLGSLQPRLHQQHPEPPPGRRGGLREVVAHLLRRELPRATSSSPTGWWTPTSTSPTWCACAQRLIELGKENWEMAVYPVENHGFVDPTSWTDEYRRIFELFERTISRPGCTDDGALCPVRK